MIKTETVIIMYMFFSKIGHIGTSLIMAMKEVIGNAIWSDLLGTDIWKLRDFVCGFHVKTHTQALVIG